MSFIVRKTHGTSFALLLITTLLTTVAALSSTPALAAPACSVIAQISPADQTVNEVTPTGDPTLVRLNGEPSKDEDSYSWVQTSGPAVILSGATLDKPTFLAPSVGLNGAVLEFTLTVKGCSPQQTAMATTTVTVRNVIGNSPPTAVINVTPPGATVNEGALVILDGSASSDPDNDPLTYSWTQTDGLGLAVELAPGSDSAVVTFTAPNVPYPGGASLKFRLTVSDGTLTGTADQIVNVIWVNDPPVAAVTCPASVHEGDLVTLESASTDNDGDGIASYAWVQTLGVPNADLSSVDLSSPTISFTAPNRTSTLDTMYFTLTVTDVGVTDVGGLSSSASCSVRVNDVTPPTFSGAEDKTAEATGPSGAAVSFDVTAQDNVDGPVDVTCSPESGTTFSLGTTLVTCSATDAAENDATATFTVTVQDTTKPTLTLPGNLTAEATGPSGAVVNYSASASDIVDGAVTPTCVPASGATFPITTTTVECSATDAHGNKATGSFTVTVQDTTPPTLTLPSPITAEATGASGAAVPYTASATDLVDSNRPVACVPASSATFPLGTTTVNCSASDTRGNSASGSFSVTVVDRTPPSITVPDPVTAVATSNSTAVVTYSASATDLVDGSVAVNCSPASGSIFPVGTTTGTCLATDAHNNTATKPFNVVVTYNFTGFFQPVDNLPASNLAKAGSAIPVKFSLHGNQGLNIFAVSYPSAPVDSCSATASDVIEETVTAGGSGLQYDPAADQYIYVWKTDKTWAGKCRQFVIKLNDGTVHWAKFSFTK